MADYRPDWVDEFIVIAAVLAVCIAAVVTLLVGVRQTAHHYDVIGCHQYATASGYQTKFVDYSYPAWDCLVQIDNGRWVPKKQLHGVNQ